MTGKLLPLQLVYQGKTRSCLPSMSLPSGWDVTFTINHWYNEVSMECFIHNIIVPYVQETREKLQLDKIQEKNYNLIREKRKITA